MIISDDQGHTDFGFMGNRVVRTPHLDRLAASGALFPRGYVPTSLCRASLATLLTGLYGHQHGVCFNDPPAGVDHTRNHSFLRSAQTLPRLLKSAGYASFQTGKFWEGHFENAGFTSGLTTEGRHGGAGLVIGRETLKPIDGFLDSLRPGQRFLLWYAPMLPHTPHQPPPSFLALYEGAGLGESRHAYYATISWFDQTVGDLLGILRARRLDADTLVLFVVDNGWAVPTGEKGWRYDPRSKNSPFEAGVRTPIILVWPGRIPPMSHDDLVSTIDVVPTVLDAAGSTPPRGLPGLSLLPVAQNTVPALARKAVFGETYLHTAVAHDKPALNLIYRWVREGNYKLIIPGVAKGPDYHGGPFLFDLSRDEAERHNLYGRQGYTQNVERLRRLLDNWWAPPDAVLTSPSSTFE